MSLGAKTDDHHSNPKPIQRPSTVLLTSPRPTLTRTYQNSPDQSDAISPFIVFLLRRAGLGGKSHGGLGGGGGGVLVSILHFLSIFRFA